ncbi:MAG: ABC transporter substrate-binding protein, partial [Candidatus Hermodarchaeota archaeon]
MILSFVFFYQPNDVVIEEPLILPSNSDPEPPTMLTVGSNRILQGIDPLNTWDSGSYDVINQVAEGLFGLDHSTEDNEIVRNLADGSSWNWAEKSYTVYLEQNVVFHDGYPFNATAVKFTFDRLQYFKDNGMLMASSIYDYYDPETGETKEIINDVEIINEFTVKFHLNVLYGPFEALLAAESSFILSPESTPPTDYIDTYTGILVGTGPFVYENYVPDLEVSFRAFENYWGGEPSIDYLKFRYIEDANERADLLASGEVQMILDPPRDRRAEFEMNPDYTIDSVDGNTEVYLGMNNYWINRGLREAISYAIDYDYMINNLLDYDISRLTSPIPNGIVHSYEHHNVPVLNVIHARTMMQSMGYGVGLDLYDDAAWESSTFLSLNYTYNFGSATREAFYPFLVDNLGKIGIEVLDAGVSWSEFLERLFYYPEQNMLQLFLSAWAADYNDPINFINSQFTNRTTGFNTVNYNGYEAATEAGRDPYYFWDNVQLLMEAAMFEPDYIIRDQYYYLIQQLLVEEDMPWAYLYVYTSEIWYTSDIQGFLWNALEKLNFHGVTGVPYVEAYPTMLILGTNRDLFALDPLDAWDSGSWDVIDQVAEGLFGYDHTTEDNEIVRNLAVGSSWDWGAKTYTVYLRQGVEFHDGYRFNATAVKFTFDRIQYFMDNGMLMTSDLYHYYDPETGESKPIINNVEIIDEYTVKFHLDVLYGPFEALLAFESSFILSPESTSPTDYIDTAT